MQITGTFAVLLLGSKNVSTSPNAKNSKAGNEKRVGHLRTQIRNFSRRFIVTPYNKWSNYRPGKSTQKPYPMIQSFPRISAVCGSALLSFISLFFPLRSLFHPCPSLGHRDHPLVHWVPWGYYDSLYSTLYSVLYVCRAWLLPSCICALYVCVPLGMCMIQQLLCTAVHPSRSAGLF